MVSLNRWKIIMNKEKFVVDKSASKASQSTGKSLRKEKVGAHRRNRRLRKLALHKAVVDCNLENAQDMVSAVHVQVTAWEITWFILRSRELKKPEINMDKQLFRQLYTIWSVDNQNISTFHQNFLLLFGLMCLFLLLPRNSKN